MKAISIDIETTGLNVYNAEILEVAFVAFDTEVFFEGVNSENTIRFLIVKQNWHGEVFALTMNQSILEEIKASQDIFKGSNELISINTKGDYPMVYINGNTYPCYDNEDRATVEDVLEQFYLRNNFTDRIVVAGKNFAGFDKRFLDENPWFGSKITSRFHHRILDPGSMYTVADDDQVPCLEYCLDRAGLNKEVPHTAVEDAVLVIKVLQAKLLS